MKRFFVLMVAFLLMQMVYLFAGEDDIVWMKNTHDVKYVQFSPDSKMIATNNDGQVLIHDVETQETLFEYNPILKTRFTPDGKYLVGYFNTNELIVIDLATGKRRENIEPAPSNIRAYDISSDGKKIIASYKEKYEYSIWDIESGQIEKTIQFPLEDSPNSIWAEISSIFYGKDDKTIIFTVNLAYPTAKSPFYYTTSSAHLVDAITDNEINRLDVAGRIFAISNDKNYFIHKTANNNTTAFTVYDAKDWKSVLSISGISNDIKSLAFSPDDKYVIAGYSGAGYNIVEYKLPNGEQSYVYKTGTVYTVDISKDGKYIAAGHGSQLLLLNTHFGTTDVIQTDIISDFRTYPNPTNANLINIEFNLLNSGITKIQLFDLTGRLVRNIYDGLLEAGLQHYSIDLTGLASGQYNIRIDSGLNSIVHSIIINR